MYHYCYTLTIALVKWEIYRIQLIVAFLLHSDYRFKISKFSKPQRREWDSSIFKKLNRLIRRTILHICERPFYRGHQYLKFDLSTLSDLTSPLEQNRHYVWSTIITKMYVKTGLKRAKTSRKSRVINEGKAASQPMLGP